MSTFLLFILAGMVWAGLMLLVLAVFMGIRRIRTPKPDNRWEREWAQIERDLNR